VRPDYVGLQRCFVFTLPTVKLLGTMGLAEGTREDSSIFYSKEARVKVAKYGYYCQICGSRFTGPNARNNAIACEKACLAERRNHITTVTHARQAFDTGAGFRWLAGRKKRKDK